MNEGLVIGIRPVPRPRIDPKKRGFPKEENIPKTIRLECESFAQQLKGLPNAYVDGEWRDSEDGWFYFIVLGIGLLSNVVTIAEFILKRKKGEPKIEEEKRTITIEFIVTISNTAYPNHPPLEEIRRGEDIESIRHKLETAKTDLSYLKEELKDVRCRLEKLRRNHDK